MALVPLQTKAVINYLPDRYLEEWKYHHRTYQNNTTVSSKVSSHSSKDQLSEGQLCTTSNIQESSYEEQSHKLWSNQSRPYYYYYYYYLVQSDCYLQYIYCVHDTKQTDSFPLVSEAVAHLSIPNFI